MLISEIQSQSIVHCLEDTVVSISTACEVATLPVIDQLHQAHSCLIGIGVSDFTIEKMDFFLHNLQKYIAVGKCHFI